MAEQQVHLFPHIDRLLSRIESLEAPIVQLWGWPGSGKIAVLEALLARYGARALALPLAVIADVGALREALDTDGVRWLVATGEDVADRLAEIERWLRPGQRLVFATGMRRGPRALPGDVVPPQEFLLTVEEAASLSHLVAGLDLAPGAVQALREATDGWYRPLRLALEAVGATGLEAMGPEDILQIPAVRLFLRHEVLDSLPQDERPLLFEASQERPGTGEVGEEAWRVVDERGWWVEGPDRDRLPRLLAAALDRERRRRRPAGAGVPARSSVRPLRPAAADRPLYELGLLGNPIARERARAGEVRDLDCRLKRSFQVLAFLASAPGLQAGREELVEAVWPTEGERTIERNFHPTLSHLRRALDSGQPTTERPAPLLFRAGVYSLNPEIDWEIDVVELARLEQEGRDLADRGELAEAAEVWRRAWKLYRGPFLQGHYEAWVESRREIYQSRYLKLLRELGDLCVRLGRAEEAMDAYRTVLFEDPLQERVHLAVMRLYAEQGRRDLVRRQYDHLCQLLLDELSVAPSPDTAREYHRLMT